MGYLHAESLSVRSPLEALLARPTTGSAVEAVAPWPGMGEPALDFAGPTA